MKIVRIGLLGLPAMLVMQSAPAAPTQAEVDRARGECHRLKLEVQRLEAGRVGDPAVSRQREQWESACARANTLMDARAGRSTPEPARPAPMDVAPMEEMPPESIPDDVPDEGAESAQPAPLDIS